jgi:hypothetical protein
MHSFATPLWEKEFNLKHSRLSWGCVNNILPPAAADYYF